MYRRNLLILIAILIVSLAASIIIPPKRPNMR